MTEEFAGWQADETGGGTLTVIGERAGALRVSLRLIRPPLCKTLERAGREDDANRRPDLAGVPE
jgi:hypothetical protein